MSDSREVQIWIPSPGRLGRWWHFSDPVKILCATTLGDVKRVVAGAEALQLQGHHVLGFVSYEAGPAFDAALTTHPECPAPLAWFAAFRDPVETSLPRSPEDPDRIWIPQLDETEYTRRLSIIRDRIASGDTYQVNATFPMTTTVTGEPLALFTRLYDAQPTPGSMLIDTPDFAVCSVTPEVFFHRTGSTLLCRPMKGTAPRGASPEQDRDAREQLIQSEKDRAENIMIVDMIRNDLSRIAQARDVRVSCLFEVSPLPTVWQMTSTVEAITPAGFTDIMTALFPCASITGAPKVETTKIIFAVEHTPRGIYTGAIGHLLPGGDIRMQVAIRTVWIDKHAGTMTYGTGSGVVWDSTPDTEYRECLAKAAILNTPRLGFLETMRFEPGPGIYLYEEHLSRMAQSAEQLGAPVDIDAVRACVMEGTQALTSSHRIRLVAYPCGQCEITIRPVPAFVAQPEPKPPPLSLAPEPFRIHASNRFLYHKTLLREAYDQARAAMGDADDIVLMNERGEVTEFTYGNLVLERNGQWLTPPVTCGLLNGTFRQTLLNQRRIQEQVLHWEDLHTGKVWFINSVRGWQLTRFRPMTS